MITANTCPICTQSIQTSELNCPNCRALVQFDLQRPPFNRQLLNEDLVQAAIERVRETLRQNPTDGTAHYTLALAYLNMGLNEQGIQSLHQSAQLLPEKHVIRYELALCEYMVGNHIVAREAIKQALQLAPEQRHYQYLDHHLAGAVAYSSQGLGEAVRHWTEAYRIQPEAQLARATLENVVAQHEAKLLQPIARSLKGLPTEQAEALSILLARPDAGAAKLPHAPRRPRNPGKWSMLLIRRIAASRAVAVEQIHAEQLARYETALAEFEQRHAGLEAQNQVQSAQQQQRVAEIRADLPLMSQIFAAIADAEARVVEEQRRREAQRQLQVEQRQAAQATAAHAKRESDLRTAAQAATAQATQAQIHTHTAQAAPAPAREKRYHATRAKYLQGLPVGKSKDSVDLVISNQRIVFKNSALIGGWEYALPISSLVEAAEDVQKQTFSSEKRLRISYRDQQGMIAHVILTDVKIAECVQKILKARANA